ncbi:MAG: GatB/YqeY domain-containing protein [Candidatus Daviesbacteria bacterium]|nr:GatB/YqeY domain-containing protein [Candidatus Daviesbacteria bacterium]
MILDTIQEDLKKAQLNRDETSVSTLRMLLSEINYGKIRLGRELSEEEIIGSVQKEIKKRQESILAFRSGKREDLAQKEESEVKVLVIYLPPQLSDAELTKVVEDSITKLEAKSLTDMGSVMAEVRGQVGNQADPSIISVLVKERLS